MIDTAGTLTAAGQTVLDEGASRVYAAATHAVFSGNAFENLAKSNFEQIVVTGHDPAAPGAPGQRPRPAVRGPADRTRSAASSPTTRSPRSSAAEKPTVSSDADGRALLMERLGLTDDELCRVLDRRSADADRRRARPSAELPILLALTEDAAARVVPGVLRRWVRSAGPAGPPARPPARPRLPRPSRTTSTRSRGAASCSAAAARLRPCSLSRGLRRLEGHGRDPRRRAR
jgi:hypothetical protein